MTRSKTHYRGAVRRSRPGVEGLESRRLMAATLQFTALPKTADPTSIVAGPDGNYWFTVPAATNPDGTTTAAAIGEINPTTRAVSLFPVPTKSAGFGKIVSGPEGVLWFTVFDASGSYMGAINPINKAIVEVPVPSADFGPRSGAGIAFNTAAALAAGPDGDLWFTDAPHASVGVFDVATLKATEFALPNADERPTGIVSGPGGKLWYTAVNQVTGAGLSGVVGSIEPTTHAIAETSTGVATIPPFSITVPVLPTTIAIGPDGNPWFIEATQTFHLGPPVSYSYNLAEIDPTTRAITKHGGGGESNLVTGPDGNVWFPGFNILGMTVPSTGATSTQDLPGPGSATTPVIATGPDGHLWLAGPGYIAEATIIPPPQAAVSGSVSIDPTGIGTTAFGFAANQAVFLDLRHDGILDPGDPVAVTDAFGGYTFAGLAPGTYTVRVVPYPGVVTTSPASHAQTVTAAGGGSVMAGNLGISPYSSVLPVNVTANPFGTHNPDFQTAEVNGLYQLLFGRAPDPTGLANSVAFLKAGGSLVTLTQILEKTTEYESDVVASYYTNFLHRSGSPSEIAAWVGLLKDGYTEEQVAQLFVTSAGFNGLYATDAGYIEALFEDFLGRQASASEVAAWDAYLNVAGRAGVAHQLIYGGPTMTNAVVGLSVAFEGQIIDAASAAFEVSYLTAGKVSLADVVTVYASSAAFIQRANATVG